MIIDKDDKVIIVNRRLYHDDKTRYFIGSVLRCEGNLVKVAGHTYFVRPETGFLSKKKDLRTRIFSLSSGSIIVYQIPNETNLDALKFVYPKSGGLYLIDEKNFQIDLGDGTAVTHEAAAKHSPPKIQGGRH